MRTQYSYKSRDRSLRAAYLRIIRASKGMHITRKVIISLLQEQPAPRFYIEPDTARVYIKNYKRYKGKSFKEAMVADLKENLNRLKAENPDAPQAWLYEEVVKQPAKSYYMSDHRIEEVIFNYSGRNGK